MYARSRLALLATVVLPLLVLIASCGDDNDADISPASTSLQPSTVSLALPGNWDFDSRAVPSKIQIHEDGSYLVLGPDAAVGPTEIGQYELEGETIIFRASTVSSPSSSDVAACADAPGRYRLIFDGFDTVDFEKVEDECPPRASAFSYPQLVRSSG